MLKARIIHQVEVMSSFSTFLYWLFFSTRFGQLFSKIIQVWWDTLPLLWTWNWLLLLLLLSCFSRVQLCATPQTAAPQGPSSLGFSRQEHWSGCHFLLQCTHACSGLSRREHWSGLPLEWPQIGEGIALLIVIFIWHSYHTMPCFLFFIYNFSTNNSFFE